MRRGLFQLLSLVLAVPGVAHGAGFDCAAASAARERLVCEDKALSATDEQLNKLYVDDLGRLSSQGARILRADQRHWLRYLNEICLITADRAQRTAAVSCLSQAYALRLRDLRLAAFRKGPFLFSRVDSYGVSVLDTRTGQRDTGLATHHVAYPRIDRPATNRTALLNTLMVRGEHPSPCGTGDGDTWTDYSLGLATAKLISIAWTVSDYCNGTPHGFGENEAQTLVLLPQPHPLAPDDLFRLDAPWAERLARLLLAGVRQAARDKNLTFDESESEHVADVARDTRRWSLRADGLGFQFDAYEIGPYIFQPRVVIPWADLHGVMVTQPPVPLPAGTTRTMQPARRGTKARPRPQN